MDHLDVLLARPDAVLRAIAERRATSTASRGFRVAATGYRHRQLAEPRRHLRIGAAVVCLGLLAEGLVAWARWGGLRGRFRAPPRPSAPRGGPRARGLSALLAGAAGGARDRVGLARRSRQTLRAARRGDDPVPLRGPMALWRPPLPLPRRRGRDAGRRRLARRGPFA
jgi:hypothetical protein